MIIVVSSYLLKLEQFMSFLKYLFCGGCQDSRSWSRCCQKKELCHTSRWPKFGNGWWVWPVARLVINGWKPSTCFWGSCDAVPTGKLPSGFDSFGIIRESDRKFLWNRLPWISIHFFPETYWHNLLLNLLETLLVTWIAYENIWCLSIQRQKKPLT